MRPGNYQFSKNESAAGTYYYRTAYDGNATYANATSSSVSVNVVASVVASVAGAPAVSAQSANTLDLFFRGTDGALWWKHWDGTTWSASTSLGGILTSDPSSASPGNGQIDVFVRGNDSAIWEKTSTDGGSTWSGWHSLGGQIPAGTAPAVCSWGSGRLDLFVQGTDGALWHKWYTGTSWSGWQSLGGKLTSSAAAATASRQQSNRRVRARHRRGHLAEDDHERRELVERLDLSRRPDSRKHRTSGLLMELRACRPLCERHRRPAVVEVYHERRELVDRLARPQRTPR